MPGFAPGTDATSIKRSARIRQAPPARHIVTGAAAVKRGRGACGAIRGCEGADVRRGEVLGLVGNSGNSSAPHMHLHVMSAPSALAASGLPYVLDGYELLGRIPSTEAGRRRSAPS